MDVNYKEVTVVIRKSWPSYLGLAWAPAWPEDEAEVKYSVIDVIEGNVVDEVTSEEPDEFDSWCYQTFGVLTRQYPTLDDADSDLYGCSEERFR